MHQKWLFLFLLTVAAVAVSRASSPEDLAQYHGKNRLLLVFAPGKSDPRWQKQNALLAHSQAAFWDRDLLRFDYFGTRDKAVRARYGVEPGQFRVLLIGKDGHVASASPSPISLSALTEQIDRMPMRRDEMRQRGQK